MGEQNWKVQKSDGDRYDPAAGLEYPLKVDLSQLELVPTHHWSQRPRPTKYGRPKLHYAVYLGDTYIGHLGIYKVHSRVLKNSLRRGPRCAYKSIFEAHDPLETLYFHMADEIESGKIQLPSRKYPPLRAKLSIE